MKMMKFCLILGASVALQGILCSSTYAGDNQSEKNNPIHEYDCSDWVHEKQENSLKSPDQFKDKTPYCQLKLIEDPVLERNQKRKSNPGYAIRTSFKDNILDKLPQGNKFRYAWDLADGEEDIFFEGMRADIGNKGLSYALNDMPFDDVVKFKLYLGGKNELAFTTRHMPFVGEIKGFSIKGAAGDDGSRIFARYTIPLD